MPKLYDASIKHLPADFPREWALFGRAPKSAPVTVIMEKRFQSQARQAEIDPLWTAT
jgi:hypothetical protein